ncbi:MAG: M1 family metallopeptidase [Kofleriaceae bacterium]
MSREFAFPGTRPRFAPDRVVDIEHLALRLRLDLPGRSLEGEAELVFRVIAPATQWIELDAVELSVRRVSLADEALEFRHDGRRLRVRLPTPQAEGARHRLVIAYAGAPRRGLYFIGPDAGYPDKGVQVWSQGQDEDSRYWFPCFDAPHEKATSEVEVTIPASLFAVSNGELLADRVHGDLRTLHWRLDVPHSCYLVTLAVGDFVAIERRWRDVPVVYYVERGKEDAAERTLQRTPQMLELFSTCFGVAYPYARYAQVFVSDFIFGGMENTSATTLTDTVLMDERASLDYDVDTLVSHELAHQWFGDLVTCRDWGEGWLNEGFATYCEYLWREHYEGRDAADLEAAEWANAYFGEDAQRYRRTLAIKHYDEPIDIFDHHLYEKGGRVLHMLRHVLGDDAFFRSVRQYLTKHRHGAVESRDLARAIEDATGRVVDWFFSQWVIDGAGHPELEVELTWEPERGAARVSVAQTQALEGRTGSFRLPTRVRLRVDGVDVDRELELVERHQVFFFELASEPSQMIFDPGRVLLASVKVEKSEEVWIAELRDAALAIDRIAAARSLAKQGSAAAHDALVRALRGDAFWAVRDAAASALARRRTDKAAAALVAALKAERHPRARRGVVRALGELRGDASAEDAVLALVRAGDPSYFVEAEACLALGKLRSRHAPEALRAAAGRASFLDVIAQHAYRGLAEARDDSAVALLLEELAWGRPAARRRAAIGALAQLARGRRDRDAAVVREELQGLLEDRDFRVQAAAIEALGTIGDPASIGALRRMIERELDGRLLRRGREVVRDLAEGGAAAEQLRRLREELEELREVTARLRERLDGLEPAAASPAPAARAKRARAAGEQAPRGGGARRTKRARGAGEQAPRGGGARRAKR